MAELLQFPPMAEEIRRERALENSLELSDAEARRAALDIRRSWIVEAPAGSGKTGLLIQRLLKILAYGDVQRPGEVLAITFTRKAAAELRNRVLEQLIEAAAGKPLKQPIGEYERITRELAEEVLRKDRLLRWHLLESPQGLNIRTIDSFCSELAAGLPLLSGGMGRRQPVEDAQPFYQLAAERAIRELGGPNAALDEALRCLLLHRDAQIGEVVRLIAGMLGEREQWGELVPLDAKTLTDAELDGPIRARLEATLDRVICAALSRAARTIGSGLIAELARFAARLSPEPGHNGAISPIALCGTRHHPPGATAMDLDHWLALAGLLLTREGSWRKGRTFPKNSMGFELPKHEKPWLEDLISQLRDEDERNPGVREALASLRCLPPARYPDDHWRVAKALFRVLRRALAELEVLFAERSLCDFTAIALTARRLLGSDPDLLATPALQLSHLLVDEMQDTSAGQYQLLELLTRSWDGATQTLFLVGDPKQSIYLFRQARVARFLRTQADGRLGDVPLGQLRLTANFRSQAELVYAFNTFFEQVLPRPRQRAENSSQEADVPFVAAIPTRGHGVKPALHWHARVVPGSGPGAREDDDDTEDTNDPQAEDDARAIRTTIEEFVARWNARSLPPEQRQPAKVAVLGRNRSHLAPVIAEFHRDRGHGPLPFRAVEIELLNERPEVLDLLSLTRALLHPGDRVAWLAVLHSPVCGLGLADLLALTGEGSEADPAATITQLVSTRAEQLSPEGQRLLARAWGVLSEAQQSLGRTAFSTHIERTWRSLGADAPLRTDQRANAYRFFELLRRLEAGPDPLSQRVLDRGLSKLYAEPLAAPDAVELMTIHKAKGLEWDLVLVPALGLGAGNSGHALLKWMELDDGQGGSTDIVLAPIHGKGEESSALSKWVASLTTARENAETKRLLYVACTRAREELHLFASCSYKKDGELATPRGNTLLRASWAAAMPVITELFAAKRRERAEVSSARFESALAVEQPLALAAVAQELSPEEIATPERTRPLLRRLPLNFDPLKRFQTGSRTPLPYVPAHALRHATPFERPEGSFAARAFGNILHRFLDLLAQQRMGGRSASDLLTELMAWRARVHTAFRAEGLPPVSCARETDRALHALQATLKDETGSWILAPHAGARSERPLQLGDLATPQAPSRSLRADRVFFAGPNPLSQTTDSHLWIVDFKTAEPGGRPAHLFFAEERAKYEPQLQAYAQACRGDAKVARPIVLALFYPLLTHLLYWPFEPSPASD